MATVPSTQVPPGLPEALPPLVPGERLDQKTFHARYEAMPPATRAELIGGIVYMPSPLKWRHGRHHGTLMWWLTEYECATPHVETADNATVILGEDSEPQPDACMLIALAGIGQARIVDGWLVGAPELGAEVADSSEDFDLDAKKRDYEQAGIKEYVVIALRQQRVYWFVLRHGKYEDLAPGVDGMLRSGVFPGLWLDPAALLARNTQRLREVLHQGLASPEHAAFVQKLQARNRSEVAPQTAEALTRRAYAATLA